ncbi:uncharacterized protein TEOVI_000671100 [Trypanosoma equiperdum]|uniref:Uncharacterized protein n=2 Tax=Trypanozoon TaxID=39700 RepID=Q585Y9_TRYB2|nr:hypothetical protein, conserved [Trypanosoma brucei brucei TREU927]AAX80772.1 hypothetical protein, conserved [Trypanosoma brucei]AAZ11950.1 hypothetical protein, conserved [Trypanosoma brucei brucei TREU927]SCU68124.1 hypothetical protein, conserved [Trypanosoma equiperdum]
MSFDMEVLREALLRAQYSRRTIPQLSDFPTCVSEEEVQQIYLPFLADEESQVRKGLAVGSVEIIGYRRSEELTIAGDCIAAALPVASILSNAPYLL